MTETGSKWMKRLKPVAGYRRKIVDDMANYD